MVCNVKTVAFNGISAQIVDVQASKSQGLPGFVIVGLPDKAVNESRERVRAVFMALGIDFPSDHIVVNLSPADVLKEGTHFDLPIALALMGMIGTINPEKLNGLLFMGALSLDGSVEREIGRAHV